MTPSLCPACPARSLAGSPASIARLFFRAISDLPVIYSEMNALPDYLPERRLFETNLEDLSDLELLALAIGPGSTPEKAFEQAELILRKHGTAARLGEMSLRQLRVCGLSRRRAASLLAAEALFRRARRTALFPGQPLRSSREVLRHFQPLLDGFKKECFWTVLADGKSRVLKLVRISEGSLTASLVHPREVFRAAVREAAAGVLCVHNHPSGDPQPSQDDILLTRRLVESGRIVGIPVLDHVIIGGRRHFSFADQGML